MSKGNDMNNREKLAREWAMTAHPKGDMRVRAAMEYILATTKPPTMAEIEWETGEHYMSGVTSAVGDRERIMLAEEKDMIVTATLGGEHLVRISPDMLTPNGKRYKIVELTVSSNEKIADEQPEHPKFLHTLEDYEEAPVGTIIGDYLEAAAGKTEVLWQKLEDGYWWRVGGNYYADPNGGSRPVIRWGRGE